VEPAAPPGPPGDGPILAADMADALARGIVLLGGEGPASDAGRVGLDHADPAVDVARGYARSGRDSRRAAVGTGHVGIAAMIDVQQRPLRPLEHQPLATRQG